MGSFHQDVRNILYELDFFGLFDFLQLIKWSLQQDVIKVCVTGAAGQIAYSLLFALAKGDVFGSNQVDSVATFF